MTQQTCSATLERAHLPLPHAFYKDFSLCSIAAIFIPGSHIKLLTSPTEKTPGTVVGRMDHFVSMLSSKEKETPEEPYLSATRYLLLTAPQIQVAQLG